MVTGLCKMLAPVLVFTADEAWNLCPAERRIGSGTHLATRRLSLSEPEQALWKQLMRLRDPALNALEQARQAKTIGKALDARLTLKGPRTDLQEAAAHSETLRELLNVSALSVEVTDAPETQVALRRRMDKSANVAGIGKRTSAAPPNTRHLRPLCESGGGEQQIDFGEAVLVPEVEVPKGRRKVPTKGREIMAHRFIGG